MSITIPNPFSSIAEAVASLAESISSIADAFKTAYNSARPFAHGDRAKVYTGRTGAFYGHICETRSASTVTVARESDGVLVHVSRSALVWTTERSDD